MSKYVNVYKVDQGYGGPEEGGWYYDYGVTISSVQTSGATPETHAAVLAAANALADELNEGRPEIYSVSSEGRYSVSVEEEPAENWPQGPVYYE